MFLFTNRHVLNTFYVSGSVSSAHPQFPNILEGSCSFIARVCGCDSGTPVYLYPPSPGTSAGLRLRKVYFSKCVELYLLVPCGGVRGRLPFKGTPVLYSCL